MCLGFSRTHAHHPAEGDLTCTSIFADGLIQCVDVIACVPFPAISTRQVMRHAHDDFVERHILAPTKFPGFLRASFYVDFFAF